jgi:hypothetical protein
LINRTSCELEMKRQKNLKEGIREIWNSIWKRRQETKLHYQ